MRSDVAQCCLRATRGCKIIHRKETLASRMLSLMMLQPSVGIRFHWGLDLGWDREWLEGLQFNVTHPELMFSHPVAPLVCAVKWCPENVDTRKCPPISAPPARPPPP